MSRLAIFSFARRLIAKEEVTVMRIKQHRASRTLMYTSFIAAGISVWFLDLPFFNDLITATIFMLGLGLTAGGMIGFIGHYGQLLQIERAGYPVLITSLLTLVLILFFAPGQNAARTFIGLILLGTCFGLYGRSRDLKTLVQWQRMQHQADDRRSQSDEL